MTNPRQQFNHVDVLRLEVEATATGLVNLVPNPSGELGGYGWITPVSGTLMQSAADPSDGAQSVRFVPTSGVPQWFYTEPMPVVAGQYVGAKWIARNGFVYKVRLEWLNTAGTLLSSSTQSGYYTPTDTTPLSYAATVAPASTAFVRLRFDVYQNTSGANPIPGNFLYLRSVTVAKAATAAALGVTRTNLFPNPSFETNTTGWSGASIARVSGTTPPHGTYALRATGVGGYIEFNASAIAVTGDKDYTLSFYTKAATTARAVYAYVMWLNSDGSGVGSNSTALVTGSTSAWTRSQSVLTAPAGATSVVVTVLVPGIDADLTGEQHYFDGFMLEEGFQLDAAFIVGTAASEFLGVIDYEYQNIIGPTHKIKIHREGLNLGTLSATILDTSLDPATANLIRPGRKCRLMTLNGTVWEPLFTGKVDSADVQYDLRATDPNKVSRIFISAVDNIATLANTSRPDGVGTMAELPYVLEGAGVPWSIDGNANQVASAVVVSNNDNASALDQIAITRDSNSRQVLVARNGVLTTSSWNDVPVMFTDVPFAGADVAIPNPGFESAGTGSWVAGSGTTITNSTTTARTGTHSLRLARTSTTGAVYAEWDMPVQPNKFYRVSYWFKAPVNGYVSYSFAELHDAAHNLLDYVDADEPGSTSGWTEVTYDFYAPQDADHASFYFDGQSSTTAQLWYFDDFSVTEIEQGSYSDIDVSFSTKDVINDVRIKSIEWDPADPTRSVEVAYGPYRDEPSITEWGTYAAEFTVHGLTAAQIATLGASILTKNKTPQVQINSIQVPILTTADLVPQRALVDLYDSIAIYFSEKDLATEWVPVTSIEHTITTDGWLMDLTFAKAGSVATPQVTPPVQSSGAGPTGWITATLAGSWAHFDGAGVGRTVQYMRDNEGWVHFRGLCKSGGNTTITTVPVGFRPEARVTMEHHFPVAANAAFGCVRAGSNGVIDFIVGSDVWVDMSPVTYKAVL